MKWITQERVKVDGVFCPWLIEHFIDQEAEFEFLPLASDWSTIGDVDRVVYDVPNCELRLCSAKSPSVAKLPPFSKRYSWCSPPRIGFEETR